ncbi:MAG: phosphopyruvate hydratase, partial [Candidatus Pacebacteria bacterium]|nr:phosphopyruvate hydratase [Candidatus Paceibacterota bacterium]
LHGTRSLDIQEFMGVFPAESFREKLNTAKTVFHKLGENLTKKYGLEGGFSPNLKTKEVLDLLTKVGKNKRIKIILDAAASCSSIIKTPQYYLGLIKEYPILGIEDPFPQDEWENWQRLNAKCKMQNAKLLIIGDDLTVTNPQRIRLAHQKKACNALIIKPNQIGTVSETIEAVKLAKSFGWKTIVSHRSGETMDDFIADLAVGLGADFIKAGAPFPEERMVKYNRLVKIEKEIHG